MNGRVLVVEDDSSIRETVTLGLERAGLEVVGVEDGRQGLAQFRHQPFDLVILDVLLPSLDGFEICREIRKSSGVPIVMLTALTDTADIVTGLEIGADDYITKPFEMAELVARARASLRRAGAEPEQRTLRAGGIEVNPAAYTATLSGRPISLTTTEFKLLFEFVRNAGLVLSREQLLRSVWDYGHLGDSRLVDVAVQRLRAKIETDPKRPSLLVTVRGVGYRLERE